MNHSAGSWELIRAEGNIPPPMSHHSLVEYEESLIMYGGIHNDTSNGEVYKFSPSTSFWEKVEIDGEEKPKPRDDHAACISEDK